MWWRGISKSRDLFCALETLCRSLQVWDSKHRRSYFCMAEVDSESMPPNAFLGVLAVACAEVSQGARWAQAMRRACCAVGWVSSIRANAKLTSPRRCELKKFICTMHRHCCKQNEPRLCSLATWTRRGRDSSVETLALRTARQPHGQRPHWDAWGRESTCLRCAERGGEGCQKRHQGHTVTGAN